VAAAAADVGKFEDDEATGKLVRVDTQQTTLPYPHARPTREQQARGELPTGAGAGASAASAAAAAAAGAGSLAPPRAGAGGSVKSLGGKSGGKTAAGSKAAAAGVAAGAGAARAGAGTATTQMG
jgi:hypothetical protein